MVGFAISAHYFMILRITWIIKSILCVFEQREIETCTYLLLTGFLYNECL